MTLKETIKLIEEVASEQPSIRMVVQNDVFRLNAIPNVKYGVFSWVQGQHSTTAEASFMTFQFTFFYVDRLMADKTNQIEVQSVGIQTLDNIIRQLNEKGIYADSYSFQPFSQRFLDECAGVFCNVSLDVPIASICPEDFSTE